MQYCIIAEKIYYIEISSMASKPIDISCRLEPDLSHTEK